MIYNNNPKGPILCQYCGSQLIAISQSEVACTKCNVAKLERRIVHLEEQFDKLENNQILLELKQSGIYHSLDNKKDKWF